MLQTVLDNEICYCDGSSCSAHFTPPLVESSCARGCPRNSFLARLERLEQLVNL